MNYMGKYWGLNFLGHDASICVVDKTDLIFYSKLSEPYLNKNILEKIHKFGKPDLICYYEKPFIKRIRQIYSGEWNKALHPISPKTHLMENKIFYPIKYFSHHESHASAAYFTSSFEECLILVADAIGEWDTLTLWYAKNSELKKIESKKYPYSLGLFYSAFTKLISLV